MSLSRILNKPKGISSFASDTRWVLPTQLIGYEVEYEGVKDRYLPDHSYANHFQYHREGSLRDNGAEYVFSQPLFGADAWNAISWLVEWAKQNQWKCTKRTGIHIHIDVRDLEVDQLSGMSLLYAAVEPILYQWIGGDRETSHFCIPLYKADDALLKVCSIVRQAYADEVSGSNNAAKISESLAEERYAGFNVNSLAKFGSLEYRQLATTHDIQKIEDWINILMSLKAAAYKLPRSDGAVIRMIEQFGTLDTLLYVFPKKIVEQLYTSDSKDQMFEIGLPSARDIAVHGCQPLRWEHFQTPKGDHPGFKAWLLKQKKEMASKKNKGAPREEWIGIDDPEDDDVVHVFRDDPRPAEQPQPPNAQIRNNPWGINFAEIEQRLAAQGPAPRVNPVAPQLRPRRR